MPSQDTDVDPSTDGRRARRHRGRVAVIEAMFELLQEGQLPPSVDAVATRAGVSVTSVFRYFGSLDGLREEAMRHAVIRFGPMFVIPDADCGDLDDRIKRFVDARLSLYQTVWPIARLSRLQATESEHAAENIARLRTALAHQIRSSFGQELAATSPGRSNELAANIDCLTSPESWELHQDPHQRTRRQIRQGWINALTALLDTPPP